MPLHLARSPRKGGDDLLSGALALLLYPFLGRLGRRFFTHKHRGGSRAQGPDGNPSGLALSCFRKSFGVIGHHVLDFGRPNHVNFHIMLQCTIKRPGLAWVPHAPAIPLKWLPGRYRRKKSAAFAAPKGSRRNNLTLAATSRPQCAPAHTPRRDSRSSGRERSRLPVAAKTAFEIAGARHGTPGSPIPVGSTVEGTMCTSTFGISLIRVGS